MQDPIPGPWDHDLSRRQPLNRLSHPDAFWQPFLVPPLLSLFLSVPGLPPAQTNKGKVLGTKLSFPPSLLPLQG